METIRANRHHQDLAGATINIHQTLAGCGGANQGLTGALNGKVQTAAPSNCHIAIDLHLISLKRDFNPLLLGAG